MCLPKNGITLIALIITIIVLLILAGITINLTIGEGGIFSKTKQAKVTYIGEEIKEQFLLAIQELQLEKRGKITLDDITQEWIDSKLPQYKNRVMEIVDKNQKKITILKDDVAKRFLIDGNLKVTDITSQGSVDFSYIAQDRIDNKVNILIYVQDIEYGLRKIEIEGLEAIEVTENKKDEKEIPLQVEIGQEYKVKITTENGKVKEQVIEIDTYWHKVTMNLDKGVIIDKTETKAEYNKPYEATISKEEGYILETITVTMGGQPVTVDIATGNINIAKVTGDIEIKVTAINFKFKAASAGVHHSLGIDESGNLWAWGNNSYSQLGNGTTRDSTIPIKIKSGTKFKAVSGGEIYSLAIDVDGNLWAWGRNWYGELGNGTTTNQTTPVQIKIGTKFKEIAAGYCHSLAIDENGNLWAWGNNENGQLGNGTTKNQTTPVQIKIGTKFKAISAGSAHSLGIDESGNLWAWGYNYYGQLGNGTTTNQTTPVQIKNGTKFNVVSAGASFSFGIDEDGNLWAWGHNNRGQIGNGTTENQTSPIQIKIGTKFKEIAVGIEYSLGIDESGNLWAWGYNADGQIGNGTTNNQTTPMQIKVGTKFKSIGTGYRAHSLGIDESGNLWAWGRNGDGQLGNGSKEQQTNPIQIVLNPNQMY